MSLITQLKVNHLIPASREPVYDRDDPDDYVNMLYCKAWKFAVELTKDLNPVYTRKQNLAFVLKVGWFGSNRLIGFSKSINLGKTDFAICLDVIGGFHFLEF